MQFTVDKPRLQRMIAIVRDDRRPKKDETTEPFVRIEARSDGMLKLSGPWVEAEFPATVHEPGVLFLRITLFRRLLKTFSVRNMTFQANQNGLTFGDVRYPLESANMLFYPDPDQAPERHPADAMRCREEHERTKKEWRQRIVELEAELKEMRRRLGQLEGTGPKEKGLCG